MAMPQSEAFSVPFQEDSSTQPQRKASFIDKLLNKNRTPSTPSIPTDIHNTASKDTSTTTHATEKSRNERLRKAYSELLGHKLDEGAGYYEQAFAASVGFMDIGKSFERRKNGDGVVEKAFERHGKGAGAGEAEGRREIDGD